MSDFQLNNALSQTAWSANYLTEYSRTSGFLPYMKGGQNAVINVNRDLTKSKGEAVRIPYFNVLSGAGVTGTTALKGAEEALGNYAVEVRVDTLRNGVLLHETDLQKTDLALADVAAKSLKNWSAAKLRDGIVTALGSIPVAVSNAPDSVVAYSAATESNKDAWNAANADRIVFGTSTATASGDNSADLATIASTQKLSAAVIDLATDRFEATSTFKINPMSTDATAGREYKVLFVNTTGFNQLRADADIKAAMQYSWTRDEMQNPIFQGGDLLWNQTIIRKIPEIGVVGTVGASSAKVAAAYLCGANAVGIGWAAMPQARSDTDDYGEKIGVGIREVRGITKMTADLHDLGIVTVFHAV